MRRCCNPKCAKWSTFSLSLVFIILGLILSLFWELWFFKIIYHQLSVSDNYTKGYQMWQETPIPMYLDVYMFNWTNADEFQNNPQLKPVFKEMGPYTFYEHHIKENVTFNNNDTLTYLNKRLWRFEPSMSSGGLDDVFTVLNPIALIVANMVKNEHKLVQRAVNFFIVENGETLYIQKPIHELLFDGYKDPLLDIATKLNLTDLKLPFTKFGWFVDRNGSAIYDGVFNMHHGGGNISKLGLITQWNYQHRTPYYYGQCSIVNASSGELWYPPHNDERVAIFSPDMCSNVNLRRNGSYALYGVEGVQYTGQADVFDNGTYYESSKCFATDVPTGVRGVSKCKFGAPAYMSFPHFYLADPVYRDAVEGMYPDPAKHTTKLALEPNTGMPLEVRASFQLNLLMTRIAGIDMYSNVKTTMMPCFWFVQRAQLTSDLASFAKLILISEKLGTYLGYSFIGLGALFFTIFGLFTYKRGWNCNEEETLLNHENL